MGNMAAPARAVLLVGALYFVVGAGSAALDPSVPDPMRFLWRLAAWLACAAGFVAHVGYEQLRWKHSPRTTARHAAMAVALGAFLLAVSATIRATTAPSHAPYWRYALALVAWPIITALPAFLVALVGGLLLSRLPRRA